MDSEPSKLQIFFFPYLIGGHLIPMMDIARVFASHGVKATIITTPENAILFQNSVQRDQQLGHDIDFHTLQPMLEADSGLPEGCENQLATTSVDPSVMLYLASMKLKEPFENLVRQVVPDCLITDMFYPWTADIANDVGIPRIIFHCIPYFPQCAEYNIQKYSPHEKVGSDSEPFIIPGLPDSIEMTRSRLPDSIKTEDRFTLLQNEILKSEEKSYGVVINSFYELEPDYADYYKNVLGKRAWHIGPVSLCNNDMDVANRGNKTSIEEQSCLSWLDSKEPKSVLYINFGSLPRIAPRQLVEIAHGLEARNNPFIWVVGRILNQTEQGQNDEEEVNEETEDAMSFMSGFEEIMKKSNRGLIIRGWAPQLMILRHVAVGGYLTHCGWNSILESVSCGVPLITWPITSEQFYNEKLVTEVVKIGVSVGNEEWMFWLDEPRVTVDREKVKLAVERLMGGGEEAMEMRRRVKELAEMAKTAVEEGGSSYASVDDLIQQIMSFRHSNPGF